MEWVIAVFGFVMIFWHHWYVILLTGLSLQLESALKAAESAHASLETQREKSRSFMFTEEEFKSLQLQVDGSKQELNLFVIYGYW